MSIFGSRLMIQRLCSRAFYHYGRPSLAKSSRAVMREVISDGGRRLTRQTYILHLPKCAFHTSPPRYNPIFTALARQIIKVVTIFTGRAIRNWYQRLPKERKQQVLSWLIRHKWKFLSPLLLILLAGVYYYQSHIEETPITKRKRFIAFTPEQFMLLNKIELEAQLEQYRTKLMPTNDPSTRQVAKVAKQLIEGNRDIEQINKVADWSVSVINDPDTMNAFVLPSGNIFVFTGLLKICENDDQLGIVLSHEISHAILGHGIEMISFAHVVDFIFIGMIAFLWMFLPTDFIAIMWTALSRFALRILMEMPYNKMLETEADEVGLELAAKACFDVRESSAFWTKMSVIEKSNMKEMIGTSEPPIDIEFLKTHPSHEQRCKDLERLLDSAIKCRSDKGCPALPKEDPRERVKKVLADIEKQAQKTYDGVLRIT